MESIFGKPYRDAIISRIDLLNETSSKQWGKMSVYQMIKHCSLWDEWILGKNKPVYKQEFIGRLFGKMALRKMTKNNNPLDKNVPTSNWLKIKEPNSDVAAEKNKWISLINEYANYSNPSFIHDFFGKMTIEEIGILAYKHSDHHLRQFGC
jgi:Protein of unknown function (DUF1569)